jgi:glyoxylase-like metal-dependent hydrolase (beta-lactamase superfamily II)
MRVHHISAGTMCPIFGRSMNREARMVCHCLLVETGAGLVLVDSGLGLADLADPRGRLGGAFTHITRPRRDPVEAAIRQIERLGFKPADVRHIVVTHLDLDHAGGIPDFPGATVHCYRPEHEAAVARATVGERHRYRRHQIEGARFELHAPDGEGDRWLGFAAVKPLAGLDIALVPLVGHTRGHAGVAVKTEIGWLLHCGDAYFHEDEMDLDHQRCPLALRAFQRIIAVDDAARVANQGRLRELRLRHGGEVKLFCAHDPSEFAALAGKAHSHPQVEARLDSS